MAAAVHIACGSMPTQAALTRVVARRVARAVRARGPAGLVARVHTVPSETRFAHARERPVVVDARRSLVAVIQVQLSEKWNGMSE